VPKKEIEEKEGQEETINPTKNLLGPPEKEEKKEKEKINFEMEENIHSYLIYLLAAEKKDYEELIVNSKPWRVLVVICLTQFIQIYALTIMLFDTLAKDENKD